MWPCDGAVLYVTLSLKTSTKLGSAPSWLVSGPTRLFKDYWMWADAMLLCLCSRNPERPNHIVNGSFLFTVLGCHCVSNKDTHLEWTSSLSIHLYLHIQMAHEVKQVCKSVQVWYLYQRGRCSQNKVKKTTSDCIFPLLWSCTCHCTAGNNPHRFILFSFMKRSNHPKKANW